MKTPRDQDRTAPAPCASLTYVYGWPAALIEEKQAQGPFRSAQIFNEAGEVVHQWSTFIPPEFSGIVIETLLFDWYAVAHVPSDDLRGHASPHIVLYETLWAHEHMRANEMKRERAQRHR